jgi:hypothetical protein
MSFAVKGETHEGNVLTLRGGFATREAAEDHPVQLSLWKRVFVEQVVDPVARPPQLPPLPWDWVIAGEPTANGSYHAYLVDATGRKIAAIWGRGEEKALIADAILRGVNL